MSALTTIDRAGIAALERPGDSPVPVMCLHGFGSHAQSYGAMMTALRPGLRALAWDMPGYGGSQPLPMPNPSAEDYAAALARFLDACGLAQVVLVGHSLGTLIAAAMARLHPQRVKALLLLSPTAGYGAAPGDPVPEVVAGRLKAFAVEGAAAYASARAANLVHDPARHADVVASVARGMAALRHDGFMQAGAMLACARIFDDLAKIQAPALVAVGVQDKVTTPDKVALIAAAVPPDWRLETSMVLLPECGHALTQQQPRLAADLVARVVDFPGTIP
ncbi:MAG: alpha/beta fold hydrolase [Hyphomicrobiales bacterium]|nr:alpha/beta fold hydrolase [Hyphomicrobiales bacterium]